MKKMLCLVLLLFTLNVFAGTLAVPDGYYEYSTVIDLDSNKTYSGKYHYSASRKSRFYLEDTWVNLEYNGKPLDPLLFMNINVNEQYNYMGRECAFLNGGKTTNNRIIICDSGSVMYLWTFYSDGTKRYMFSK